MSGKWQGSTRAQRLPRDWHRIRSRVLKRDPTCRRCKTRPSTEVHHAHGADDHRDQSLEGICHPCHQRETQAEAVQARARKPKLARQPEVHPGLR